MENALLMICGLSAIAVTGMLLLQAAAARVLTLALPPRDDEDIAATPAPPPPAPEAEAEAAPADEPITEAPAASVIEPPDSVEGHRVLSPFDGVVDLIAVEVAVGDKVEEGQVLARVEAMNGIHEVKAPHQGEIKAIHVELGAEVDPDQPIMTIG